MICLADRLIRFVAPAPAANARGWVRSSGRLFRCETIRCSHRKVLRHLHPRGAVARRAARCCARASLWWCPQHAQRITQLARLHYEGLNSLGERPGEVRVHERADVHPRRLGQYEPGGTELAGYPCGDAVGGHIPGVGEGEGIGAPEPAGWRQDGELASRQRGRHLRGTPDDPRALDPRREQLGVLIEREDGHPVRGVIREADLRIDSPHGVGEGAAAGDDEQRIPAPGRGSEHGYYYIQCARAPQKRPADFDDGAPGGEGTLGGSGISGEVGIRMVQLPLPGTTLSVIPASFVIPAKAGTHVGWGEHGSPLSRG